jgi:hypothetical protein
MQNNTGRTKKVSQRTFLCKNRPLQDMIIYSS